MEDVYGSARLLALPALLEPWGLVCNEAMQCGTPCVVSPLVGAAGDLVRHGRNGLVLALDPELWAERIAAVLGEPGQWQALSDRGRADVGARDLSASVAAFRAMIARAVAAG